MTAAGPSSGVLAQLALQFGHARLEAGDHLALGFDQLRLLGDERFEPGDAALVLLGGGRVSCHTQTFAATLRDSCLLTRVEFLRTAPSAGDGS